MAGGTTDRTLGGFGEPAPRIVGRTCAVERYALDVAAGRWLVLLAFGSAAHPVCRAALDEALARSALFDDRRAALFGLSLDGADRADRGVRSREVGVRILWDLDQAIARGLGLVRDDQFHPRIALIDPMFRIVENRPVEETGAVLDRLEAELAAPAAGGPAPVLVAPRIFEPELCGLLLQLMEAAPLTPSGFSVEVEGRTVQRLDPRLKRRQDFLIEEPALAAELEGRLERRLFPLLEAAFAWRPTVVERLLLCRYAAEDQGFFSAHRDNVTSGTAHRTFAVSLNLNDEGFEGGDLRFPEFGPRTYRPPAGGAVVFSCSLLHEVTPVTSGVRYAFVPFLYDEAGARIRAANLGRVAAPGAAA